MFIRLQDILRSYLDFEEAWEELNWFLRHSEEGEAEPLRGWEQQERSFNRSRSNFTYERIRRSVPDPQEDLKQDYKNLEVPYKSDFEDVKKSYKTLLRKYHPDHFAQDREKCKNATEITKKINESFHRIKEFHEHEG